MTSLRASAPLRLCLSVLALAFACGQEPAPPPAPTPTPAPAPAPEPAPELAPVPEPTPPPEPVAAPVPEGCRIVIAGGSEDDAVKRALVNTTAGGLYDTTVEDGKTIVFECPPDGERKGANIIAEKANSEIVHWAKVDLGPGAEGQNLNAADAKPDLPEGLDEATLARLRAKWPDLSKWEEEEASAGPDDPSPADAPKDSPPPPAKIPVSFSAHKLYWAELKLENVQTKKLARLVLDPKGSKSLAPGLYKLSVKLEAEGAWQDAGELNIEAGTKSYTVQMLDGPPRPQVSKG